MTENQWLDQYIMGHRSKRDSEDSEISRDKNIKDIFTRGIQCHTMFLPSTDENALKNLGNFDMNQLENRFMKDLQKLKDHIVKNLGSKKIQNEELDGKNLSALIQYIIQYINEDNFPKVPSMMEAWIPKVVEQAPKDALIYYEGRMNGLVSVEPPLNTSMLHSKHDFVFEKSIELFKEKLFNDQKLYNPKLLQLKRNLKTSFDNIKKKNSKKIDMYIEQSVIRFKNEAKQLCTDYNIPMNPDKITKDREKTLQNWFVHYTNTFDIYKDSSVYDDQRELLRLFVDQQFDEIDLRNENYIQTILNRSLKQCKLVYIEKLDLKNNLPRIYEDIKQNQKTADVECDQAIHDYIKDKISTESIEWIEQTKLYKDFFSQLTQWKIKTNQELIDKNNHQVELLCKDKVLELNTMSISKCSNIIPFPDEEDIILAKVKAINADLTDEYVTLLSKFSGFDAYQHYLKVLQDSISKQIVKTIDHNADAVNVKSTRALDCAKVAIEKSQCSFCIQNIFPYWYRKNAVKLTHQCFNHYDESRNFGPELKRKAIDRWIEQKHQKTINGIYMNLLILFTVVIATMATIIYMIVTNRQRRSQRSTTRNSYH